MKLVRYLKGKKNKLVIRKMMGKSEVKVAKTTKDHPQFQKVTF